MVKSCEIHSLYLFLCQASVADPTIPGRPDDSTAWEIERRERAEDTSRGRARPPGNTLILQQHDTLTLDAFFTVQITALCSGHSGICAEILLSINACYKHAHTHNAGTDFCTYSVTETHASYLPLMNYVWAQQEMEERRE